MSCEVSNDSKKDAGQDSTKTVVSPSLPAIEKAVRAAARGEHVMPKEYMSERVVSPAIEALRESVSAAARGVAPFEPSKGDCSKSTSTGEHSKTPRDADN